MLTQGSFNTSTPGAHLLLPGADHASFVPLSAFTRAGMMSESLGPVSPPYWVLELWGDYEYALVYACVDLLVTKQEYVYFFARNASIPAPVLGTMKTYAVNKGIDLSAVTAIPMSGCEWDSIPPLLPDPAAEAALPFSVAGSDRTGTCPTKGCSESAECGSGCLCCQGLYCC